MKTELITRDITPAVKLLQAGGLVAVPTETVYGLAGNGLDPGVIEKIYEVKGRPPVKPISLMVSDAGAIDRLCEAVPPAARALAECFWPGPLTLVLKAKPEIPLVLRAGGETVGLRCPRQEQTLRLLRELEFPLAVPSANPSGQASPKTAGDVLGYFDGRIEGVIDGGACELGLESTVLDLSCVPFRILRQGSLPEKELMDALVDSMQVIGITGGSGCGKTTVLRELETRGAMVVDADAVYHELLETDRGLLESLKAAFPEAVSETGEGIGLKLDRKKLGRIVFQDEEALLTLNRITHLSIGKEIRRRLQDWAMNGGELAAIDAIALHSSGEAAICDWTLAVTAPEETRIRRIMDRDGISREAAQQRICAQLGNEDFIELCDETIVNDGDLKMLSCRLNNILEVRKKQWKT